MKSNELIEEALEKIWECIEENSGKAEFSESLLRNKLGNSLDLLLEEKLLERSDNMMLLAQAGRNAARQVIRGHRLSECLFRYVLETDQSDMEKAACQVEHIVKDGVEEKLCQLLGHPEQCPHGKPIPSGTCCDSAREKRDKTVVPLTHLKRGEEGVIAFIKAGDSKKLQKLMAMGVFPGSPIVLDRSFPAFVFSVGYSQYAVDSDMAAVIHVKRTSSHEVASGARKSA